jgi:hypothetical protein
MSAVMSTPKYEPVATTLPFDARLDLAVEEPVVGPWHARVSRRAGRIRMMPARPSRRVDTRIVSDTIKACDGHQVPPVGSTTLDRPRASTIRDRALWLSPLPARSGGDGSRRLSWAGSTRGTSRVVGLELGDGDLLVIHVMRLRKMHEAAYARVMTCQAL